MTNISQKPFGMFTLDQMCYQYEEKFDDVIRLTLGKSELDIAKPIRDAMQAALADFRMSTVVHPAGLPELRARVSKQYADDLGVSIPTRNIIINVGTSSLFRNLYWLLAREPGDEVMLPRPYYPLYDICADLCGAKVTFYDINVDTMEVDLDSLAANFTDRTRIVVINSPGNPMGNILSLGDLKRLDELIDGRAVVISDEMYRNVVFEGEAPSAVQLGKTKTHFVVTNGFSKGHRMYCRRVGFAIVRDEMIDPLTVIQEHTLLTTDPIPQYGAIAALDHPEGVAEITAIYSQRRDATLSRFDKVSNVRAVPAKGSFYLMLDCRPFLADKPGMNSLDLAKDIFEKTHVATVPGSDFGIENTLRLSYSSHRYVEGIEKLASYFEE